MSVQEILHDHENFYIACELVTGGELQDRIAKIEALSEDQAAYVIK